jgi:DNA-binding NarL/FixJ family response regulator
MTNRRLENEVRAASDQISLWIVEDDELFRKSMQSVINDTADIRCERGFSTCEEFLDVLETEFAPEVVLMDIGLPGMDGIDGLKRIKSISPATDIIMLTIHVEDEKIFRAICSGANGYLLKSSTSEEIIHAIREVLGGGAPMNAQIARKVLLMFSELAAPKADYGLTDREKEVLVFITKGLTNKAIADKLFLSYFTVDTHLKNIYTKLQVHTRSGAVGKVLKENLL